MKAKTPRFAARVAAVFAPRSDLEKAIVGAIPISACVFARSVISGCAGIAALFAVPSSAQEISNVRSVDIALAGHISQRCGMAAGQSTDLGNLSRPRISATTRVQLDCNVPFTMSIQAQRGAIQNLLMPGGQGGYQGSVPYSLNVELPVRRPDRELLTRAFEGRALVAGQTMSSLGGIAQDGMLLRLDLGSVTSSSGLLAGAYGETIVITVAPT
ncbi:hypothetical protein [Sphingomonas mali]|uniref:hypothetical protein n=1 Tax=Sphingomonas mali TaxID=40682 RepID=UPI0008349248|nr:hypothetical protein [Sphingomonas mali]